MVNDSEYIRNAKFFNIKEFFEILGYGVELEENRELFSETVLTVYDKQSGITIIRFNGNWSLKEIINSLFEIENNIIHSHQILIKQVFDFVNYNTLPSGQLVFSFIINRHIDQYPI